MDQNEAFDAGQGLAQKVLHCIEVGDEVQARMVLLAVVDTARSGGMAATDAVRVYIASIVWLSMFVGHLLDLQRGEVASLEAVDPHDGATELAGICGALVAGVHNEDHAGVRTLLSSLDGPTASKVIFALCDSAVGIRRRKATT